MKTKRIIASFIILALTATAFVTLKSDTTPTEDTGIAFKTLSFDEAKALAKEENKLIFIDAYTTWCGPCKYMAKNVFTQKAVGDYYNEHFINLKVDMEKGEGPILARKYAVRGYPTFLFLKPDGTIAKKTMGVTSADNFIGLAKAAVDKK